MLLLKIGIVVLLISQAHGGVPYRRNDVLLPATESAQRPDVVVDADDDDQKNGDRSRHVDGNARNVQRAPSATAVIPLSTKINSENVISRTSLLDRMAGSTVLSLSWPTVMSGRRSQGKSLANVPYSPSCFDGNCVIRQSFDGSKVRDPLSQISPDHALPWTSDSQTTQTVAEVSTRSIRHHLLGSVGRPLSAVHAALNRSNTRMTSVDDQRYLMTAVRRLSTSKMVSSSIERGHTSGLKLLGLSSGVLLNVSSSPVMPSDKEIDLVDRLSSKSPSSVDEAVDTIRVDISSLTAGLEKRTKGEIDGSSANYDGSGGNYETCVAVTKDDKKRCYDRFLKTFARFTANSGNKFVGR